MWEEGADLEEINQGGGHGGMGGMNPNDIFQMFFSGGGRPGGGGGGAQSFSFNMWANHASLYLANKEDHAAM